MWVKVDDALPDHPKVVEAAENLGSNGVGRVLALWLKGMCYCNHNLTDGFIPCRILKSWTMVDRRPLDVASVMVMAGIFYQEARGFRFHDFTDYQPSREDVALKRKKDLERKRKKKAEAESGGIPHGIGAESAAVPSTPARPGLSSTHQRQDHRASRAGFPQPVENLRVLKALIWREVHAVYAEYGAAPVDADVVERVKVVAARAGLAYGGECFHRQIEIALRRVPQQRGRRRAA
jgi:hypothetical protein